MEGLPDKVGIAPACYGGLVLVFAPLAAKTFGARYIAESYVVLYVVFALALYGDSARRAVLQRKRRPLFGGVLAAACVGGGARAICYVQT